ncbi:Na /H antiporter subunit [Glycocaulis alkaliphilus]|uniref:Na /H antiporter subunit n=1 Tax=Glycocaulis alkaliphilus TaxID=1434191 RepID=A0A3T0EA32_9PROT|nr:monovalent cation/H(+) antiporter subunit G [Glycocaulis alkaliphilus]AZU04130.1 Na /H antiporter subunit [Glycocaulis alkaliphilus]GGB76132.1 cation:proton antiporter [Glycocaulis alkaliphilus]
MNAMEWFIAGLLALGVFFYVAGTVGLLRFPDTHSRLHALTKADNLGLGFIAIAAGLHWGDGWIAGKLALVWLLTLFAAGMAAQLVARAALKAEGGE